MRNYQSTFLTCVAFISISFTSCKKLVTIPPPVNTITTSQVFASMAQANGAMAGIYTRMIHGDVKSNTVTAGENVFSAGLMTITGGLSSDELYNYSGVNDQGYYLLNTNKVTIYINGKPSQIWASAYNIIYSANSVIEGIAASGSPALNDSVRTALTGEARFIRAFCYFYLTNLFGDVPLTLTVDFNKTASMRRTPQAQVYEQIIADLKNAQESLPELYPTINNERVRPNRFAATAMLARVYLYLGNYADAAAAAGAVISNAGVYSLESSLDKVFVSSSREAIWQLQQTNIDNQLRNATPEGAVMQPAPQQTGLSAFCLTDQLIKAFEKGDQRWNAWTDSTNNTFIPTNSPVIAHVPGKYKTGKFNSIQGAPPREYYMMLRLAEMYLIRAEAAANGAPGGETAAISDVNMIRRRAGLDDLPASLTTAEVKAAIAQERRIEFFAEWGHRWLDLKRTGKAHEVLSVVPQKQPWAGDFQLLYPIPLEEITVNHFLTQNTGY